MVHINDSFFIENYFYLEAVKNSFWIILKITWDFYMYLYINMGGNLR